ncbi:MAG: hypothetical protein ACRDGR_06720 [bacterium]
MRASTIGLCVAAFAALPGCLGEPPIEDRWTKLEILEAAPVDPSAYAGGAAVTVRARITYRELLTGFLVADLRESATLLPGDTGFEFPEDWLDRAHDVDRVLAGSTTLGHHALPVTGFDHLIQEATLTFDGAVPTGAGSLFLVLYFSEDVEEMELPGGGEIEIVTPVFSTERDILSAGVELAES